MKISQLADALGNIDEKLIADAIVNGVENDGDGEFQPALAKTEKRRIDMGVKAASAAAALVIAAAIPILINAVGNTPGSNSEVSGIVVDLDSSSSSAVNETSKTEETTTSFAEISKPEETTTTSVAEISKPEGMTTTFVTETSKPEETTTTSVTEPKPSKETTTTSVTENKPDKKPASTSAADAESSPENKDTEKFDAYSDGLVERYCINAYSIDPLYRAFADKESDEYKALRDARDAFNREYSQPHKYADVFLSAIESGKEKLYIPKINNKDVELDNKSDNYSVYFKSACDYSLPTVMYRVYVKDEYLFISSSFPKACGIEGIENKKSTAEVISVIAPGQPLPDNAESFENVVSVYEKEITLANNFKTTALFRIYKDDPDEMNVIIYKDGVLTLLRANKNLFTDSFFASFDLAEYN